MPSPLRFLPHSRLPLMLATALLLFFAVIAALQQWLFLPLLTQVERDNAVHDIERVVRAIRREQAYIDAVCKDWAYWTDMYDYAQAPSAEFVESNLTESATSNTGVDILVVFNASGQVVFRAAYRAALPYEAGIPALFEPQSALYARLVQPLLGAKIGAEHTQSALWRLQDVPMMVVTRPILNSFRDGPAQGVLLMASVFNDSRQQKIREQTLVPFRLQADRAALDARGDYLLSADGDRVWLQAESKSRLALGVVLTTLTPDVFVVETDHVRTLSAQAHTVLLLAMALSALAIGLLGCALYWLMSRHFLQPLRALGHSLQNAGTSALPGVDLPEWKGISEALHRLQQQLAQYRQEAQSAHWQDELTGLPNRRAFDQLMQREWQLAIHYQHRFAVLLCDLDFFTHYNATYGRAQGDICLQRVAQTLAARLRRNSDMLARYEDEAFVLVLPDLDAEAARQFAESRLQAVREMHIAHDDLPAQAELSISIGIVMVAPQEGDTLGELMPQAAAALKQAQKNGRDTLAFSAKTP